MSRHGSGPTILVKALIWKTWLFVGSMTYAGVFIPEQAIGSEQHNMDFSPRPSCAELLSAGSQSSSSVSPSAQALLGLIRIAFASGTAWEPDFSAHLKAAMDSPLSINPFLNLRSIQAQALAQKAEPILDRLQENDWRWVQEQVHAMFSIRLEEVDFRSKDAVRTAEVSGFDFVPDSALEQALQSGTPFSHGKWKIYHGSMKKKYLGVVDGYYLFTVEPHLSGAPHLGLVAISKPDVERSPSIRCLLHSDNMAWSIPAGEPSLSSVSKENIWIVDGKLFVLIGGDKDQSDVLAQIDVSTGAILKKTHVPAKGRSRIWYLGGGRFVAVNFSKEWWHFFGSPVASRFYQFDFASGDFVPTGLDIGFLKARLLRKDPGGRLSLLTGKDFNRYVSDGQSLFVKASEDGPDFEDTQSRRHHVNWSDTEGFISEFHKEEGVMYLSFWVYDRYLRTTLSDARARVIPPDTESRTVSIPFLIGTGHPSDLKLSVIPVPDSEMYIFLVTGRGPAQAGWLVNRKTLKFVPLSMSRDYGPVINPKTGLWTAGLEVMHLFTADGQYAMVMLDPLGRRSVAWRLNMQTLAFGDAEFLQLPAAPGPSTIAFSDDINAVILQTTKDGMWLARKHRVDRKGAD